MGRRQIRIQLIIWGVILVVGVGSLLHYISREKAIQIDSYGGGTEMKQQLIKQINGDEVNKIYIDITSQQLNIYPTTEEFIVIEHLANRQLNEDEILQVKVKGERLEVIKPFIKKIIMGNIIGIREEVNLYVPESYTKDLEIQMTSGRTYIASIQLNKLEIDKTSGSVKIEGLTAQSAELGITSGSITIDKGEIGTLVGESTSGSVRLKEMVTNEIEFENTSGSMNIEGICDKLNVVAISGSSSIQLENMPYEMSIIKTSGSSKIALPENTGFTLEYEKSSGSSRSEFELNGGKQINTNGTYVYRDGSNKIKIRTTSGTTRIHKR